MYERSSAVYLQIIQNAPDALTFEGAISLPINTYFVVN